MARGRAHRYDSQRELILAQAAQLFAHRRPHRQIARMQPRHVLAPCMGGGDLGYDLVQRQGRGVDDPRARRAMRQHPFGHQ